MDAVNYENMDLEFVVEGLGNGGVRVNFIPPMIVGHHDVLFIEFPVHCVEAIRAVKDGETIQSQGGSEARA